MFKRNIKKRSVLHRWLLCCALLFGFSLVLFSCATLKDSKPKSQEEALIKKVLVAFWDAFEKGDVKGVSALLTENATCMTGKDRKVFSKKEYLDTLSQRAGDSPHIVMGEPQMSIKGDKADVKCSVTRDQWYGQFVFHLIKENGKWLIMGWKY
ncbi:MAG: nuclear transport factor 2 family protein [Desulfobacterales bacterium]|nr:nuclear transport factor 2 family protein [Desulfobacterales bacterium]